MALTDLTATGEQDFDKKVRDVFAEWQAAIEGKAEIFHEHGTSEIIDAAVTIAKIAISNAPQNNFVISYNEAIGGLEFVSLEGAIGADTYQGRLNAVAPASYLDGLRTVFDQDVAATRWTVDHNSLSANPAVVQIWARITSSLPDQFCGDGRYCGDGAYCGQGSDLLETLSPVVPDHIEHRYDINGHAYRTDIYFVTATAGRAILGH